MAKLKKFAAYRKLERPYTRFSKFREKSFVRAKPNSKVVRYETGNTNKKFQCTLELISKNDTQIRHNAIEAARVSSGKVLEKQLGKTGFHIKIRMYPHHILRENPLAAGAGADRMSTGMSRSFGKPIGVAARVRKGQTLVTLRIDKQNLDLGRTSLDRFRHKMPCSCAVVITENK